LVLATRGRDGAMIAACRAKFERMYVRDFVLEE